MLRLPWRAALLAAFLFVNASTVHAKPAHKQALADYFGPALDRRLVDCRTCHLPDKPGQEASSEKPHNSFGARLKVVRDELRKAGKPNDIAARLAAVADEDSDGDGVSNILELLSGHSPGDAADKPTPAEVARAREALTAFRRRQQEYAWRPFEPVSRPVPPSVKNASWVRNPIDAFVAAEHEKHGLKPRPEAPRHVLLRRVALDLTGLPPTRQELHAFLADSSPDAYEKAVNRLLDSPRYGERWGRHWMDVWRYSDWAGYGAEVRESKKHVWHWRDWIVEALNADKGYDRMVVEMLAGDELAPDDPATLRATGFLVRNWYLYNRNVWLDNAVEHTAKAFLGVTLNCARCHDHFFDAIGQQEYYAFRAFFETHDVRTDRTPGQPDVEKDGLPRAYDAHLASPTYLFVRGSEAEPDRSKVVVPAVPVLLRGAPVKVEAVALSATAISPGLKAFVQDEELSRRREAVAAARAALAKTPADAPATARLTAAEADLRAAEARIVADNARFGRGPGNADVLARVAGRAEREALLAAAEEKAVRAEAAAKAKGDPTVAAARKAVEAARLALAKDDATYTPLSPVYPKTSSGRRLALARWIADKSNPLTARVAMNQVWMRHFGRPLVPTVFDFGRNGQPPSHPALLDWLADEFMRRGWSMKEMHRLIVLSNAYRTDSTPDAASAAADPEDRWLWRVPPRRLEAESVRDAVLHVAGGLDATMGGPDLDYTLGLTSPRRSLYFRHAAEKQMEFLKIFDAASVTECYRRADSVIPQQALALANSTLVLSQARLLARGLTKEAPEPTAFVRAAFEQVLGRTPTPRETEECVDFLNQQASLLADRGKLSTYAPTGGSSVAPSADAPTRAREDLVQVLMNHNEFVTIR